MIGSVKIIKDGHRPTMLDIEFFGNHHLVAPHLAIEFANKILEVSAGPNELPPARCSNCGTDLMYGYCFNSSCKVDREVG